MDKEKRILMLPNVTKQITTAQYRRICDSFLAYGCSLCTVAESAEFAGVALPVMAEDRLSSCTLACVLGGDGSMIHAAHRLLGHDIPLLGINFGHVGYLAELELGEIDLLDGLANGQYTIEVRMMLAVDVCRDDGTVRSRMYALNDAVLSNGPIAKLLTFAMRLNGFDMQSYRADGIVIATPTGSTAYSMSAGGPILEPRLDCICLTPICPHTPGSRPILVRGDTVIELCRIVSKDTAVYISTDGSEVSTVCHGDTVRITRADHVTKLIRLKDEGFLGVLRDKFSTQL